MTNNVNKSEKLLKNKQFIDATKHKNNAETSKIRVKGVIFLYVFRIEPAAFWSINCTKL